MRLAFVVIFSFVAVVGMAQEAEDETCTLPENYSEAIDENEFTLTRVLIMVNTPNSALSDTQSVGIFYVTLQSMRHYHEDMRDTLPDCAQGLNNAYLDVISASQDMLGLLLAREAIPQSQASYNKRLLAADEHLNERWGTLLEVSESIELPPEA